MTGLEDLNQAQYDAVTSPAKRLRILAGAGSGKTRVLVQRIIWLMEQGISLNRIMAVTFTNKAAAEMRHRIEHIMKGRVSALWVGTFHGLSHRVLRQHFEKAGLPENFQIIDADDQLRLIKRLIQERGWDEEMCDPKRAVSFINRQKDEGKRSMEVLPSIAADVIAFTEIYHLYEQYCRRTAMVDFAEILLLTYELWKNEPDVLAYYQQRFSHLLVDEFQDTNAIQYAWLRLLCAEESHLMMVGDDDQSIYGWRGAKIENIHRFDKDFKDVVTIRLEQNYRSTSTILAAANALIAHNDSRLGKELWTQGVQGEKITFYSAFNEIEEARFVVERLSQWCRAGGSYEDIAILYRSNAQSRILEQALRQQSIPYRIYGGLRFFDRAEIKDVLAYLRLLSNVHDDTAFERAVNFPPRGVGDRTLETLRQRAKEQQISLWRATLETLPTLTAGRVSNGLRQFVEMIQQMTEQVVALTLPALADHVLQKSGLQQHIKQQPGDRIQGRLENLQELIQACAQFKQSFDELNEVVSMHSEDALPAFLSEVALEPGEHEGEHEATVKMMTLHSAKGLEFPLVFLVGLEDGLFPHHRNLQEPALLEEERRLCYVGITRAMRKLYITYSEKRAFVGLSGINRPSRFINEIPKNLIDNACINVMEKKIAMSPPLPLPRITGSSSPFKVGQRVRHARFGEGVVIGGEGQGSGARVHVNFAVEGRKWLVLTYAKLEVII